MALIHGGDLEGFIQEYQYEPLDFSANCNPLGVPAGVRQAICQASEKVDAYPDPLCRRLCAAIAGHEGVSPDQILCGNGSADLIDRLAHAVPRGSVLLTAPTFAEYERAVRMAGCPVRYHPLEASDDYRVTPAILQALTPDLSMVFICNPNNPTGLTVEPALLAEILKICDQNGTLLVVDECFNGFLDDPQRHSLMPYLESASNLLILKAFTKLYGMAGVRLGYCLVNDSDLLGKMRQAGQPWAVSSLAQAAGLAALQENDYVLTARQLVSQERAYLKTALRSLGFTVSDSEANYLFFRSDRLDLAVRLREKGILIRDCSQYPGLTPGCCRIAVKTGEENRRLIAVITACLEDK